MASISPSMGEPFSKNVFIVIFAGPMGSVVGVGPIMSSGSFVIPLNPKNTIIIIIDATAAPIPSDGPCINKV